MADPDPQIRGGGGAPDHPDPEMRGGGGGLLKNFFGPSGAASVWSKNKRGAQAYQAPPLDPPLLDTKWAIDHSPTSISQNVICLVRWHKQTSLRSYNSVHRIRNRQLAGYA